LTVQRRFAASMCRFGSPAIEDDVEMKKTDSEEEFYDSD
jgi:hypothetical protein